MKAWYFYGWKVGTKDSISEPEMQHAETRVRVKKEIQPFSENLIQDKCYLEF